MFSSNNNNNNKHVILRTPPQSIKTIGGSSNSGGGSASGNKGSSRNMFSSPTTSRLRSPRGSTSPRLLKNKISTIADSYLYVFLRNTKTIISILTIIAFFTILNRPPVDYLNNDDDDNANPSSSLITTSYSSTATSSIPDITTFDFFPSILNNNPITTNGDDDGDDDDDVVDDDEVDDDVNEDIEDDDDDNNDDETESITNEHSSALPQESSSKEDVVVDDGGGREKPSSSSLATMKKLQSTQSKLLSSYNATKRPVFSKPQAIQAHLIVDVSRAILPPSKFLLDGLERSKHIRLLALTFLNPRIKTVEIYKPTNKNSKSSEPMVFVVDWGSMNHDCHRLQRVLQHLKRNPKKDKLVLIDFSASSRQTRCDFLHEDKNVRMAKRGIIEGRVYDYQQNQIIPGRIRDNPHGIIHAPLVLREKFMDAIQNISSNIVKNVPRKIDVAFYWKNGDYSHYGFHRRLVGKVVKKLHHANYTDIDHTVEAFVDIAANDQEGMVEGNVQLEYIQKLVSTKIVVIAQRDEWEDHYRLMESLASGALVMTDPMLAMPAGLKNKTNIIIYENPSQLKKLIVYYLKNDKKRISIAKKGYELAAGRNRAWHRVEEVLFGRPLTHVDVPYQKLEKPKRPKTKLVVEDPIFTRR